MFETLSLSQAIAANLRGYSEGKCRVAMDYIKKCKAKGLQLNFHQEFYGSQAATLDGLSHGVMLLSAPDLETDILITKVGLGRGLFGEKHRFQSFIRNLHENSFSIGHEFKILTLCITGIGNIYRHYGLISGPML